MQPSKGDTVCTADHRWLDEELRQLIDSALRGDTAATEELISGFASRVHNAVDLLRHLARTDRDLEAATQYIVEELWKSMLQIRAAEAPWKFAMNVIATARVDFAFRLGTPYAQ